VLLPTFSMTFFSPFIAMSFIVLNSAVHTAPRLFEA